MALVQHCQMRTHGQRCYRLARVWIRISYEGYNGAEMTNVLAVCDVHRADARKIAELGPVEVTPKEKEQKS